MLDQALGLAFGAYAAGNLHRDGDLLDQLVDQLTISIVAVGRRIEIDDVHVVDTLFGPMPGPADRVVVEGDGIVETSSGETHGQTTEDVDPGIQVHHRNLARRPLAFSMQCITYS